MEIQYLPDEFIYSINQLRDFTQLTVFSVILPPHMMEIRQNMNIFEF